MTIATRARIAFLSLALLLSPGAGWAGTDLMPVASAVPAPREADAKAQAYYHFTLGHMYEEMAQLFRRGDYLRRAIQEYKLALEYDPGSSDLAVKLAEAYRRSGRIRDAVVEARQLLEENPDNLAAHRLLGHIYYQTLGERRPGESNQRTLDLAIEEFEHVVRLDPKDTDALLVLARLYRMNNDLEAAEATLQTLLAFHPQSEEGTSALALLYTDQGKYQQAIELLQGAAGETDSSQLLSSLAYAYEQADEHAKAAETYQRALERDESNLELRRRLAESLLRADKPDEALRQYQTLAEEASDDPQARLRMAQIYRRQGEFEQAHRELERAKELAPDSLEISFHEALLYEAEGEFRHAIEVLSEMVARLTHASGQYDEQESRMRSIVLEQLGMMHREIEAYDDAVGVFELLLELGPEAAQRGYVQMIETYRQARRLDAALAVAQEAVERFPDQTGLKLQMASLLGERGEEEQAVQLARGLLNETDSDLQVYLTLAQIHERNRSYEKALAMVDKAEQLSLPSGLQEQIDFLRGAIYERSGELEKAEAAFRRVLDLNPESAITLNYLGYMFADNDYNLEEAVELVKRALEIDPYNGAYLDSLGWAYFRLQRYEKAEEYLLRAVERLSRDPTIHDHLGDLYYRTERLHLAEKAWERARQEWRRVPETEFDPEAFARLEDKLHRLKLRLARENQKKVSNN